MSSIPISHREFQGAAVSVSVSRSESREIEPVGGSVPTLAVVLDHSPSPGWPIRQGKSQVSKEAWLASHNFGIDHDDPRGRHRGLDGLGPAVLAVGR